ncbi:hypothetical protein CKM354_000886300 [Cercospora kikuchii]|uniref:dipeptidyl-peptidase IV n=1 Tax=Cercospora kikuchii TaxID=84275 RepID=A0A9P3FFN2_9PEZI|nr:uncharacterized protein CKM354_000886300 [Cercospora kikuchii]GIZ45708.1 hypothetical protein CKM354_000886300 [Cercospora kikuchii]
MWALTLWSSLAVILVMTEAWARGERFWMREERISQPSSFRSLYPCCLNATQDSYPKVVVRDYNVYLVTENDSTTALSSTGTQSTPFDHANVYKSTDGKFVVVHQIETYGQNRTITVIDSSPDDQRHPRPVVFSYDNQYDRGEPHTYGPSNYLPGDDLPIVRPKLFDLTTKKQIEVKKDFIDNPYMIEDASWKFRDNKYRYMYYERGLRRIRMVEIDESGEARIIMEETAEQYIDYYTKPAWVFLDKTEQMAYLSEADGYNHVYLINTTRIEGGNPSSVTITPSGHGDMVQQVTKGNFSVYEINHVDERQKVLFFTAYSMVDGQDPYYLHQARVNYDGTGFKILTADGDGDHNVTWLENNAFEDRWSRVDLPLRGALRDEYGKKIGTVEVNSTVSNNITIPERFNTPGRDGVTQIYGVIVKPNDFNSSKKYRVIENIYNGATHFYAPKGLGARGQAQLASYQRTSDTLGVVIVVIDGMGTNWRGRAFQQFTYKNFKDSGFEDRKIWMRAAADTRPWMDLSGGVGIYGGSAGGYNAMAALLWHSEFYTAAIADAGNHDQRLANAEYGEVFMGWPVDDAIYDASSNVVNAHRLNGSLLLLVGELDDNVDPSCTLQVVNALNAAGKDFDFMIVPGAGHTVLHLRHEIVQLGKKFNNFWKNWLSST